MRNDMSFLVTSPSIHFDKKWLVMAVFGLFAASCLPSFAAVNKSDSPSLSVKKKAKVRQSAHTPGKKQDADIHWQKKQPFAAITAGKKTQPVSKKSGKQPGHNFYDGRMASDHLPNGGKTPSSDRGVNPASSVFTQKRSSSPFAHFSKNPSLLSGNEKASGSNMDINGYALGPARFSMNYEKSRDTASRVSGFMTGKTTPDITTNNDIVETRQNQPNIQLGMEYATGNGRVNASVNYVRLKDMKGGTTGSAASPTNNNDSTDLKTFAIGYTYDVSDRTSFYGMVARTDYEKEAMASYMRGNGSDEDSVTGVQFGMTHKF